MVFDKKNDSIEFYVEDIFDVGGGLCDWDVVYYIVSNVKMCLKWLIE